MSKAVAEDFQVFTAHEVFPPVDVRASSHDRAFYQGEQKKNCFDNNNSPAQLRAMPPV